MRAIVFHKPSTPLSLEKVEEPQPQKGQAIIAVKRCGVCGTDLHATEEHGNPLSTGTIMGHEYVGEIVERDSNCPNEWRVGRKVAGLPFHSCGTCSHCQMGKPSLCKENLILGMEGPGGFAEYMAIDTHNSILLPDSVEWVEGALIEPLAVGLHAVKMASNIRGKRILIMGAGPVGLATSLWCRFMGAYHISVTEPEPIKRERASHFGADIALPPSSPAVLMPHIESDAGGTPDVVFECVGLPGMIAEAIKMVRHGGEIIVVGFCSRQDNFVPATAVLKELTARFVLAYEKADFEMISGLIAMDRIDVSAMCSDSINFTDFPNAFESLKKPNPNCKIMLSPEL